jgi:hypothetical protein
MLKRDVEKLNKEAETERSEGRRYDIVVSLPLGGTVN